MAAAISLVVCDALCYLRNKFDKLPAKVLKTSLADFYTAEVLSDAKKQLLDDILALNLTIKLPHVPQRRDGDSRLTREIDDMFVLLTSLDEHKYLDSLPRYVASGPDNMPSAGMCEGDIAALMNIMKNMSNEISELRSKLVIVARDVRAIQSRPPEPFPALPEPTVINKPNNQPRLQSHSSAASGQPITKLVDGISAGESENTAAKSVSDINRSAIAGPSWANLASTPLGSSNRFGVLASTTDDEGNEYELVRSRRAKRMRNKTSSPVEHSGVQSQQQARQRLSTEQNDAAQRRSRLLVFGKSTKRDGIYAAKSIVRKAVFYVGNVNKQCSNNDIVSFVKGMNVNVFSCFEVKPRRRYVDDLCDDRKAFRLCISNDNTERMLDASLWPDSVFISKWHFKQPNTEASDGEKRRCVEVASVTEQQSATRGQLSSDTTITIVEHDSGAQNNTLSDDTILAVNDHITEVTMDVVTSNVGTIQRDLLYAGADSDDNSDSVE